MFTAAIPPVTNFAVLPPAGTAVIAPPANLFATNSPTIMEEWLLASIYVPAFLQFKNTAEAQVTITAKMALLYGGDIIWAQTFENTSSGKLPAATQQIFTPVFATNFVAPIPIRRGRSLTLTFEAFASVACEIAVIAAPPLNGVQGTLNYDVAVLSGHRTL